MKQLLLIGAFAATVLGACNNAGNHESEKKEVAKTEQAAQDVQAPPTAQTATLSPADQAKADADLILKYLKDNGLEGKAKSTATGIYYIIEKEGSGPNPTQQNTVKCHYKGTLLNGQEFDSSYSRNQPLEFPLSAVIPGWQQGIPLLKKGGKGKLLIPSGLAYGQRAMGDKIPANSVLLFDVELLDFK